MNSIKHFILYILLGCSCQVVFGQKMTQKQQMDYALEEDQRRQVEKEKDAQPSFTGAQKQFSIVASKEGFYPNLLTIFEGEKVQFFITSTSPEAGCFMLPEKNLFLSARMGELVEAQATFERPGEYEFNCPTDKLKGKIVVLKRPSVDQGRVPSAKGSRGPASVKEDWSPEEVEF